MNPYEAQRAILERLQKLESRVALMETVDHVSVGEAAGQSAYYRPSTGKMFAPASIEAAGSYIQTALGSGGIFRAYEYEASPSRKNHIEIGADSGGSFIRGRYVSGGSTDIRFELGLGTEVARFKNGYFGLGVANPSFPFDASLSNANWTGRFYNTDTTANPRGVVVRAGPTSSNQVFYLYFQMVDGTLVGNIRGDNSTGVNYNSASDERNKQDIEPLAGSLARVLALRPISYRGRGAPAATPKVPGFSAQQVLETIPQAAYHDEETDTYGVSWNKMIPDLVGAIQEIDGRLAALEAT